MTSLPFAARLAAVMVTVVLAASALTVSLNYLKFRRVLRMQEDLVYRVVADDIAGAIEDGISLGIPLNMLQTTERLIQRRRAADSNTLSVTVFDAAGLVLFDTDQYRVGTKLPPDWRPPSRDAAEWRAEGKTGNLVGSRLVNSFSQTTGGVLIRYDSATLEARVRAVLLDMVRASLAMLLAASVIAAVVAPLLTWRLRRWLDHASHELSHPGRGTATAGAAALAATQAELQDAETALMALGLGETQAEMLFVD